MDGDEDDDDDGMVRSLPRTKVVGKEGKATPCRMELWGRRKGTPCLNIFRIDIDGALGCHIHTATHYPPFFCKLWFFEKNNDLLSLRKAFKFQYINVAPNLSARSSLMGTTTILTLERFWERAVFNSVIIFRSNHGGNREILY